MRIKRLLAVVGALGLVVAAYSGTAYAAGQNGLSGARAATADFHDIETAKAAGYGPDPLADLQGITCIDNPAGGMGIHYVNGALVGQVVNGQFVPDAAVNATTPEALVYEPEANGKLRLVALEYVVIKAAWDAAHSDKPALFGQDFEPVGADNRYGLPPFYELHVWIWKNNPNGMFQDWNPAVTCAAAEA